MASVKGDPYSDRPLSTDTEGTVGIIYDTDTLARLTSDANGGDIYWFSPNTLKFFHTRLLSNVYGNRYFVTSNAKPEWDIPRHYWVCEFRFYETRRKSDNRILVNVEINTINRDHATKSSAISQAKQLAGEGK